MSRITGIPPYAGVCSREQAQRVGFGVDEAAKRLRRFGYVKQRLAFMATAHLSATPEWEVKSALALHAWLDAEHATALRRRVPELRRSEASLTHPPDEFLTRAMEEALRSRGTVELLTAIYHVIRPALLDAMERYVRETNPVADHPSYRALKLIIAEEQDAVAWGQTALDAVLADGIDGTTESPRHAALPLPRSAQPFTYELEPRRDERFHGLFDTSIPADTIYADESRPIEERNLALLFKRLREMDVPEAIAGILAQTPDKPWAFYHDMLRQLWDEARHSLLGEAGLEAKGVNWTRLPVNMTFSYKLAKFCTPIERHVLLFAIEQSLMPAPRGKAWEYQIASASGDPLSKNFHDFDWADEVLHAAIGKRHLKQLFNGDYNEAFRQADALARRIAEGLEREPMPNDAPPPDWWERFAASALGRPVAPAPKTDVKDWSPLNASA
jgi:hypothetical protein